MSTKHVSIELPFNHTPYPFQQEVWDAVVETDDQGKVNLLKQFILTVWHRRAGKDLDFINFLTFMAWHHRIGTYWYMFPTYAQGKKTIWDGMDNDGRPFLSFIPPHIVDHTNETEMQVFLKNGSIIQIVGADKYNSIVGPNPVGIGLSEFSVSNAFQLAWEYVVPMLIRNNGWARFMFTPRGKNHGYKLFLQAMRDPMWYAKLLTVDDTTDHEGKRLVTDADIEKAKALGMSEERVQQEFYCSWLANQRGTYFADAIDSLRSRDRITKVQWEPTLPVETWWDIGRGDKTSVWFVQKLFRDIRVIDHLSGSGKGLPWYAQQLFMGERADYMYSHHVMPHDIKVTEWGSDNTREDIARRLGIKPIRVAPKLKKEDQIAAARAVLPRCYFDQDKCAAGLASLEFYHREWDEKHGEFKENPVHDWSSDDTDAFMTGAVMDRTHGAGVHGTSSRVAQTKADNAYNMFGRR